MRIYLASMRMKVVRRYHELFPKRKLNVLRSFGRLDGEDWGFCFTHRDKISGLITDSGTWTLNNVSSEVARRITLTNYKNYISTFGEHFDFYFNFDDDFTDDGFENNLYNQRILEAADLKPVPVIHDIWGEEIDYYIDSGHTHVALGSPQIKSTKILSYVMNKFKGKEIKVHLFGHTKFEFITNFPIHSCDSTTWALAGAFGSILYWNPNKRGQNKVDKIPLGEYLQLDAPEKMYFENYPYRREVEQYLFDTFGLTYEDLVGPNGKFYQQLVNTHYYVQLEDRVNQIHRQKGFNTMICDKST
jgi:hypothetical protein